ncbi:MAG: hypothetical protein IPL35_13210 [Sphingobacteriales bacterium]|nr:hypothetical protein [Sphingobacteriales bacterium]
MKAQPPTQEPTVLPLAFEYPDNTVFISEVVFHADEAVLVNGQPQKKWIIVVDDITTEPISGIDATVVWKDGAASNPAAYWGGKCNAIVSAKFNAKQCGMLGYANIWAKATVQTALICRRAYSTTTTSTHPPK